MPKPENLTNVWVPLTQGEESSGTEDLWCYCWHIDPVSGETQKHEYRLPDRADGAHSLFVEGVFNQQAGEEVRLAGTASTMCASYAASW